MPSLDILIVIIQVIRKARCIRKPLVLPFALETPGQFDEKVKSSCNSAEGQVCRGPVAS